MGFRIDWSIEAIEDLESIATYIERDSPQYAVSVISDIFEGMAVVSDHPRIGRMVPEASSDTLRERIIHNYRVIYLLEATRALVLTVVHSRNMEMVRGLVDVSKNET